MPRKAAQHGTRSGYKAGCNNRQTCPGGPDGIKCIDANNKYNQDRRDLRKMAQSRNPVVTGQKPKARGLSIFTVSPRSEGSETGSTQEAYPQGDIPFYDPPEALLNAQVANDPEPAEAQHDVYNEPLFVVTPKIKADVEGKLGLFAALIGIPFEAMDPYCGKVFAGQADDIIKAMVPLILRSKAAVQFLTSTGGGWLEWIALLQALWPVMGAIYAHHLAKTAAQDKRPMPDATMPPMPDDYQYSAA